MAASAKPAAVSRWTFELGGCLFLMSAMNLIVLWHLLAFRVPWHVARESVGAWAAPLGDRSSVHFAEVQSWVAAAPALHDWELAWELAAPNTQESAGEPAADAASRPITDWLSAADAEVATPGMRQWDGPVIGQSIVPEDAHTVNVSSVGGPSGRAFGGEPASPVAAPAVAGVAPWASISVGGFDAVLAAGVARRVPPLSREALGAWRAIGLRARGESDAAWANRAAGALRCFPSTPGLAEAATAPRSAIGKPPETSTSADALAPLLEGRRMLARQGALALCGWACRARHAGSASCGLGECICSRAHRLGWPGAAGAADNASTSGGGAVGERSGHILGLPSVELSATRVVLSAAAVTEPAGHSEAEARVGASLVADLAAPSSAARALRRYESVYAKARAELYQGAVNRSILLLRHANERCGPRSLGDAFEVVLRAPASVMDYGELRISATASYLRCTGREAGDTFVIHAASVAHAGGSAAGEGKVLLQPAPVRELGHGRYSAGLLAAEPGNYTAWVFWLNWRYAGWLDLHEARRRGADAFGLGVGREQLAPNRSDGGAGPPATSDTGPLTIAGGVATSRESPYCPSSDGCAGCSAALLRTAHGEPWPAHPAVAFNFTVGERRHDSGEPAEHAAPDAGAAGAASLGDGSGGSRDADGEGGAAAVAPRLPRACSGGSSAGRWVGDEWAPFSCYLLQYDAELLERCAAGARSAGSRLQRGSGAWAAAAAVSRAAGGADCGEDGSGGAALRLLLFGDSVMRGLYFDLAEMLTGTKHDRGWAKRHAGPGKGKRLCVSSRGVTVRWSWWTLNESARQAGRDFHLRCARPRGAKGPPPVGCRSPPNPDIEEWGLEDPGAVVLFGSAAHNMRYGTVQEYEADLRSLARRITAARPVRARLLWLVGAASHIYDDDAPCVADRPFHLMSHHRSMLFSAVGVETMRLVLPMVDMWKLTVDQRANCADLHCDELYMANSTGGDGFVSRAAANLFLNAACNRLHLPPAELECP